MNPCHRGIKTNVGEEYQECSEDLNSPGDRRKMRHPQQGDTPRKSKQGPEIDLGVPPNRPLNMMNEDVDNRLLQVMNTSYFSTWKKSVKAPTSLLASPSPPQSSSTLKTNNSHWSELDVIQIIPICIPKLQMSSLATP